jgi:hypothetical protein
MNESFTYRRSGPVRYEVVNKEGEVVGREEWRKR